MSARDYPHQMPRIDLDVRLRAELAATVAAGLCANPENMAVRHWEAEVARSSVGVADKIIALCMTGCL